MPPLADAIATNAALLCFDEFQINDIADAIILGRLFAALFERAVVVVATSNTAPDDLFRGKPGRDAFLPFIALIKQHLDVLVLEAAQQRRKVSAPLRLAATGLYSLLGAPTAAAESFGALDIKHIQHDTLSGARHCRC